MRRLLLDDFAVILLDVHMPGLDGFETAALIRQRKRSEHTPIIFLTAFPDDTYAERGYSLGAVDYILTPVVPEVLRTKVSVFVDLYHKTEQIKRQAEERVLLGPGARGPAGGRTGQPRQKPVPGQRQPRAAHADERHHRHDRPGAGRRI